MITLQFLGKVSGKSFIDSNIRAPHLKENNTQGRVKKPAHNVMQTQTKKRQCLNGE